MRFLLYGVFNTCTCRLDRAADRTRLSLYFWLTMGRQGREGTWWYQGSQA